MTPMVDARVQVIELNPQGYGLQLVFSDGHERGIYPWAYLAQFTPVGASLLAMDVNDKTMQLEESARLDAFRQQSTGFMR
jgi:DUF971 family protein